MSKLTKKDEIILENEVRNELLQHFSSKSSNQALIILSLALVFFAWVQSLQYVEGIQNLFWKALWYVMPLELIFYVSLRALGRLFFWGIYADAVTKVTAKEAGSTYHVRLYDACWDYKEEQLKAKKWLRYRYYIANGRGLYIFSLIAFIIILYVFIPWGEITSILARLFR